MRFHLDMLCKGGVDEQFLRSKCRRNKSYNRSRDKHREWEYFSTGVAVQLLTNYVISDNVTCCSLV